MPVHVSIHDVSPAWSTEVDLALDLARARGIRPALLVVPNFHGHSPLSADAPFCEKLRRLQAEGHEIYLHGFYHQSRPAPRKGEESGAKGALAQLRWYFAQRVVSGGEAEFSDVSEPEAVERLDAGEAMLHEARLKIDGFVAPAWSMPSWLLPILASRGYRFTEDHTRVYDPLKKRARASLVLNYASRTRGRLVSSVAYCRVAAALVTPLRRRVPARVAIHPADMRFSVLRHEVARLLDWAEVDAVAKGGDLILSFPRS